MEHDEARVLEIAQRLMPAWPADATARVEYLPGGYSNRNYRIDVGGARYALRVVGRPAPRRHGIRERRYLEIAAAPDLIGYDERTGDMLTAWIEGELLAASPPSPGDAGRYLAALHAEIPLGIRRYGFETEMRALLANVPDPDPQVLGVFEALVQSMPAVPECGCHNDLNPWNVIRVEGASPGYRTLDWEFAGDNDPLFDLVGLGLGFEWDAAQLAICAASYRATGRTLDATPNRLEAAILAYRIREYAWAAAEVATGNDRPEIREQEATMRAAVLRGA